MKVNVLDLPPGALRWLDAYHDMDDQARIDFLAVVEAMAKAHPRIKAPSLFGGLPRMSGGIILKFLRPTSIPGAQQSE